MPGIYVRKTSEYDWIQQRENPDLTVPGSYWLCHKNNIYKFIFRYHRTYRNIKEFNFGKELMKVIRRIIKSQPRQGQQFGTSHLLVTYHQTSWTRQDKMFAMMKFKERSVAAFSHAFVLTINMSVPLKSMEHNRKNTINLMRDDENSHSMHACENSTEKGSNKCSLYSSENNFSERNDKHDSIHDQVLESENINIQQDSSFIVNNVQKTTVNSDKHSNTLFEFPVTRSTPFESTTNFNKETKENKSSEQHAVKSSNSKNDENNVETNQIIDPHSKDLNCSKVQSIKDEKLSLTTLNVKKIESSNNIKLLDLNERTSENGHCKHHTVSNIKMLHDSSSTDDVNMDTANLPYQYLIEKEIENAKNNMSNYKVCLNEIKINRKTNNRDEEGVRKRKLEEANENDTTDFVELLTDPAKTQGSPQHKKRKSASDNAASRSSDITDLVMEGLMFTIKQGQDSVTVIEQKTKLEIDEVLENSEKVETKEGEKCLRNSSLLGLENLITMIELPNRDKNEHDYDDAVVQENVSTHESAKKCSTNNTEEQNIVSELNHRKWKSRHETSLASTSFVSNDEVTDTEKYEETYDEYKCEENTKFGEDEDPEYAEEEDEDIIPEALQNEVFQSSRLSLNEINISEEKIDDIDKNLLMDDADLEETMKFKPLETNSNSFYLNINPIMKFNETHKLQQQSINTPQKSNFSNRNNAKLSTPRIISNQIITVDQIPLALQKALKLRKYNSLNYEDKVNEGNTKINEMQLCQKEDISADTQSKTPSLDCSALESSQSKENSKISVHSCNEGRNECTSSDLKTRISKNDLKLEEENLQEQNVNIQKEKPLSQSDIQDITKSFYQHFSNLQMKKNTGDHRYLRSRRKSVNASRDGNNGETHIEMMKLFHDITRGAKVVIRRLSTKSIDRIIGKSSSLAKCMH